MRKTQFTDNFWAQRNEWLEMTRCDLKWLKMGYKSD